MRKATRRTVWVPVNPILHAVWQASKLTAEEWNQQIIPVQIAMDALLTGDWTKQTHWNVFFTMLCRIEAMLKLKHADDFGMIQQSRDVFVAALDREANTGAKAFRHDELAVMREIVQVYGDLLKEITHRDFKETVRISEPNIARIVRRKAVPELEAA